MQLFQDKNSLRFSLRKLPFPLIASAALAAALCFCSGFTSATVDYDPPDVALVSVDKTSVDVTDGYQLVTVTLSADDATDVVQGYKSAIVSLVNVKPDGSNGNVYKYANFYPGRGDADANGGIPRSTDVDGETVSLRSNQLLFTDGDFALWRLYRVYIEDTPGNSFWYYNSSLNVTETATFGTLPDDKKNFELVAILDGSETKSELTLRAAPPGDFLFSPRERTTGSDGEGVTISDIIINGSDVRIFGSETDLYARYPFSITNRDSSASGEVILKFYGSGVYRSNFEHDTGSSSCRTKSLTTANPLTIQTCAISSLSAGEKRNFMLTFGTTETVTSATLTLFAHVRLPEVDLDDNLQQYYFTINRDSDGDGVQDSVDAFPKDSAYDHQHF